jgi:hypothetical protein
MAVEITNTQKIGIKNIIKRKKRSIWFPAIWIPFAIMFLAVGFDNAALVIGFGCALMNGLLNILWLLSKCPRCGNGFYTSTSKARWLWFTTQCRHCGLSLEDA